MVRVLMVIGSARKGRVADKVAELVQSELSKRDRVEVDVVDLAKLNLPFFDNENAPSNPDYKISHESVKFWSDQVLSADTVVFITPEYNHNLSAIQKNAIDSLYLEWNDKPSVVITYGWYGGSNALAAIRELAPVIKIDLKNNPAELYFTKDIQPDGSLIDGSEALSKISRALESISGLSA